MYVVRGVAYIQKTTASCREAVIYKKISLHSANINNPGQFSNLAKVNVKDDCQLTSSTVRWKLIILILFNHIHLAFLQLALETYSIVFSFIPGKHMP